MTGVDRMCVETVFPPHRCVELAQVPLTQVGYFSTLEARGFPTALSAVLPAVAHAGPISRSEC